MAHVHPLLHLPTLEMEKVILLIDDHQHRAIRLRRRVHSGIRLLECLAQSALLLRTTSTIREVEHRIQYDFGARSHVLGFCVLRLIVTDALFARDEHHASRAMHRHVPRVVARP